MLQAFPIISSNLRYPCATNHLLKWNTSRTSIPVLPVPVPSCPAHIVPTHNIMLQYTKCIRFQHFDRFLQTCCSIYSIICFLSCGGPRSPTTPTSRPDDSRSFFSSLETFGNQVHCIKILLNGRLTGRLLIPLSPKRCSGNNAHAMYPRVPSCSATFTRLLLPPWQSELPSWVSA